MQTPRAERPEPPPRRPGRRPPWWPEDEQWPPRGGPWRGHRGGPPPALFIRAIAMLFMVLALLAGVAIIAVVVAYQSAGAVAAVAVVLLGAALCGLLLVASVAAVGARRLARPLSELIDAARRVEGGEYGQPVRVPAWGPRGVRELAQAFNTMMTRLGSDQAQRRALLADISHELRTPLTVLRGQLEAMLDGVYPADPKHLGIAIEETQVLARLIDDLRTLSLTDTGTLTLHREPLELALLLVDTAEAFRGEAERAGVRIEVAAEELPALELDAVRMREVVANLLANALRYAPAGSAVALRLARAENGRSAVVTIEDAGPGIAPELRARLFERFAKTAESRGSGLGLAVARGLVEAHAGTIRAEVPEGGAGTRMRIELPVE